MNITFTPEELEAIGRNDLSGFDHELSRYELIAAFRQLAGQKREAEQLADDRLDEITRLEQELTSKKRTGDYLINSNKRHLERIAEERERDRKAFRELVDKMDAVTAENARLRKEVAETEELLKKYSKICSDQMSEINDLKDACRRCRWAPEEGKRIREYEDDFARQTAASVITAGSTEP